MQKIIRIQFYNDKTHQHKNKVYNQLAIHECGYFYLLYAVIINKSINVFGKNAAHWHTNKSIPTKENRKTIK